MHNWAESRPIMTNNSALMTSCVSTAHCSLHFACHPFDGLWCVVLAAVLWAQIARVLLLLAFATNCCCLLSLLTFITFIVIFSTKQAVNLLQTLLHYFFVKLCGLAPPPPCNSYMPACMSPTKLSAMQPLSLFYPWERIIWTFAPDWPSCWQLIMSAYDTSVRYWQCKFVV